MTFTEFMSILNGEYKETAGTDAKNQCVDLANAYIQYVLGLPIIQWTNAVDFPSKAGDKYDWILNTPTGVPLEGDLVIWGGTYGHIAVFIEGDQNRFTSFDENFPVGSPCHVQEHNYDSPKVIGWLHPKVILSDLQTQLDACRSERDRNWTYFATLCHTLNVAENMDMAVAEIRKLTALEDSYNQKDKQINDLTQQVTDFQSQLDYSKKTVAELTTQNEQQKKDLQSATDTIISLQRSIEELTAQITKPVYKGWKKALIALIDKL